MRTSNSFNMIKTKWAETLVKVYIKIFGLPKNIRITFPEPSSLVIMPVWEDETNKYLTDSDIIYKLNLIGNINNDNVIIKQVQSQEGDYLSITADKLKRGFWLRLTNDVLKNLTTDWDNYEFDNFNM